MRSWAALFFFVFTLAASVPAQDTVQVKAGWNIIGSVKAGAVPDVLTTDPPGIITTSFFGYDPGAGYQSTDTLGKGLGYWVKVSTDGIIAFNTSGSGECGVKTLEYAGFTYRTVKIGGQCWLDRNLNVGTMVTGMTEQNNNGTLEKYCYMDDPANCTNYGGLYQWNEAMQYSTTPGTQGICPPGWHIPMLEEFQALSSAVGGEGNALKALVQGYGAGAGTDTSGFSALLAGFRSHDGFFNALVLNAFFWSSTEYDASFAHGLSLEYVTGDVDVFNDIIKNYGFSVRCLED